MLGQTRGGSGIERVEEHAVEDSYNETVGMLRDKHVVSSSPTMANDGGEGGPRGQTMVGFIDMGCSRYEI